MESPASASFERLFEIIRRLRGPDGCKWDKAQTPSTLRTSLVEETWEAVSAIDAADDDNLQEELGDLFLLLTMISWMKEQEKTFTLESVLARICEKLIRRHPHIFGESQADSVKDILSQWETIKKAEKGKKPEGASTLDKVPRSLPPLEKAHSLQDAASKVGFDWPDTQPVWGKLREESDELAHAVKSGDARCIEEEIGDLLFTVVNLSRLLKVDPAVALHGANGKFERRFREIERRLEAEGKSPAEVGLEGMDRIWDQIKSEEDGRQRASK